MIGTDNSYKAVRQSFKHQYKLDDVLSMNQSLHNKQQSWILAQDIGQCLAKNRVMLDENYFTKDTVVRREVKHSLFNLPTF